MDAPAPTPGPSTPPPAGPVSRSTQFAAVAVLAVLAGLIGWRYYADRFATRPTDHVQPAAHRVDLNRATKAELMQVPGIGPQLAERIVSHRDTAGRFARVEDLDNVYGIGGLTLDKLRPWLTVGPVEPETPSPEPERLTRKPAEKKPATEKPRPTGLIDINRSSLEELQTLPGIGPVYAQRIIDERTKKPFAAISDLRRVSGIGPKRFEAIKDLVTVGK
jgi:competence protein ComEA